METRLRSTGRPGVVPRRRTLILRHANWILHPAGLGSVVARRTRRLLPDHGCRGLTKICRRCLDGQCGRRRAKNSHWHLACWIHCGHRVPRRNGLIGHAGKSWRCRWRHRPVRVRLRDVICGWRYPLVLQGARPILAALGPRYGKAWRIRLPPGWNCGWWLEAGRRVLLPHRQQR